MRARHRLRLTGLTIALGGLLFMLLPQTPVRAAVPAVIISEIMYHPASEIDNDEFVELYNTTSSSVDVSGWCFVSGINGCLPASTVISAHSYFLLSRNSAQTQTTYGVTPDAIYIGKLDNGGEQLVLKDAANATVIDMTYDDVAPWPTAPDGDGPSLELKDNSFDGTLAASWGGSQSAGGTPGATNSLDNPALPTVGTVTQLAVTQSPSVSPTITATASNATTVGLIYKVMFGADTTLPMFDDGNHNDGAAGDGVYGANLPSQPAGKLVRYKVIADNASMTVASPGSGDSISYYAYMISDGETSSASILRWFMDPADFTDMITNHLSDHATFPAVVILGDRAIDNATVRVKGDSTVNWAKKKYKFQLPTGHRITMPDINYDIDTFLLEALFPNSVDINEKFAWDAYEYFGVPTLGRSIVAVYKNNASPDISEFYSQYLLTEDHDKTWRDNHGYSSGALYKEGHDKKTRLSEDDSDIQSLKTNLTTLTGASLKQYLYDNIDIPNIINFRAVSAAIRQEDWTFTSNIYQYRDTEGSGRWSYLPSDVDSGFQPLFGQNDENITSIVGAPPLAPLRPSGIGQDDHVTQRIVEAALFQFPEFREMYFRRLSTVYDQLYGQGKSIQWFDDYYQQHSNLIQKDIDMWWPARYEFYEMLQEYGYLGTIPPESGLTVNEQGIPIFDDAQDVKNYWDYSEGYIKSLFASYRQQGLFVPAQPASPRLTITEIMYNPTGGSQHEYLELYNTESYAVDISGWTIDGIGLTMPGGSVLPAHSYGLVVKNDAAFKAQYGSGKFIMASYSGDLANEGETITLKQSNGAEVSKVSYGADGNWPGSANGQGHSLALIRTTANETMSVCWSPSQLVGGTPGLPNTVDEAWVAAHGGCVDAASTINQPNESSNLGRTGQTIVSGILLGGIFAFSLTALIYKLRRTKPRK